MVRRHTTSSFTRPQTSRAADRRKRHTAAFLAAAATASLLTPYAARAASQTWSATPTSADFNTAANWAGNAVPGIAQPSGSGSNNVRTTDVAIFNTPIFNTIGDSTNPITTSSLWFIRGITFDSAAGPYVIGTSGGTLLSLDNSGSIQLTASVTNPQVIAGPIQVRQGSGANGTYNFVNNSTTNTATLSITNPTFTLTNANGRPTTLTLDGTNTGFNVIASDITDSWSSAQTVAAIVKNGAGTWWLTGNNAGIIGTNTTNTNAMLGMIVNAGTLVGANNNAFGSSGTANQLKVAINSGGTLQLANNPSGNTPITVDNGVSLNLNDGGTINVVGSQATNGRINVGTTVVNATISTTSATDVFTIGNEANDVTGGSATTVLHVTGPGQVLLNQPSNYVGTWSFDGGTTTLGDAAALGTNSAGVTVSVASTGKLQLNSRSITIGNLMSAGSAGVIENGGGSPSTLTLSTTASNTFGATLQDGTGGGNLSLTKSGLGSLTLTGPSTYSGGTTVDAGTLLANNSAGSATGTGPVAVNNLATLGGSGTLAGAVTVNSGGTLSPGASGAGSVGTLTVGSLSLAAGSNLFYDIASPASLDKIVVSQSGGLTIDGGQITINDNSTTFTTNGVYNLIGFSGAISGGLGNLSINPNNKNTSTNSYTIGSSGGFVTLTVASSGGTVSYWNTDASGNWATGPWTTPQPNAAGAFASFGGGGTPITANRTITIDGTKTVGTLAFNNPSFSYTLNSGTAGQLNLDNGASSSFITDSAGSHFVNVPMTMTDKGLIVTATTSTDSLALNGDISGPGKLTKAGAGTLTLTGNNSFAGGVTINAGTVAINSANSLGDPAAALTFAGGSLQLTGALTSSRNYNISGLNNAVIDTNGLSLSHFGVIAPVSGSPGGVIKNGAGLLFLQGTNTYIGATTINAGTLAIVSNNSLGDPAAGAQLNLGSGTTLSIPVSVSLNNGAPGTNDRNLTVGAGGTTIDIVDGATLSLTGNISGGVISKTSFGTLSVNAPSATHAGYDVSFGTLNAGNPTGGNGGGLGSAVPITLRGGAILTSSAGAGSTMTFNNPLTVPAGETANLMTPIRFNWTGPVTGSGTINVDVTTNVTRFDLNNNFAAFSGNLNLTGSGGIRMLINGGSFNGAGMASTNLNIDGAVNLVPSSNSGGNTVSIGALSSTHTDAGISPQSQGGGFNFNIGALGTDTSFAGFIQGSNSITKVGSGTLTLNGIADNMLYIGTTTVNAGTLRIGVNNGMSTASPTIVNTGGTLDIAAVSQSILSLAGTGGTVTLTGPTAQLSIGNSGASIAFAGDVIGTDATLIKNGADNQSLGSVDVGTVTVNGQITLTGPAASRIASFGSGGFGNVINLNSKLVLPNTSQSDAKTILANGKNFGAGIVPLNDGLHGIALTTVSTLGTSAFPNLAGLTGAETLLVGTYYGDLNLDGKVNGDDYTLLDRGAAKHLTGWINGDMNDDGTVDTADYLLVDTVFGTTGVPHDALAAFIDSRESQFGPAYAASLSSALASVPEPSTLTACGLALTALPTRRRRPR